MQLLLRSTSLTRDQGKEGRRDRSADTSTTKRNFLFWYSHQRVPSFYKREKIQPNHPRRIQNLCLYYNWKKEEIPMYPSHIIRGSHLGILREDRLIFQNLSFELQSGQLLFLKGPNGSGKSTFLRMLAGYLSPSQGSLQSTLPIPSSMHFLDDKDLIKPSLTPFENLFFWSYLLEPDLPTSLHSSRCSQILEFFDLAPSQSYLSLGQRKRLAISRFFLKPQPIWILDEPLLGLDLETIHLMEQCLENHLSRGGMLFLSSHSNLRLPNPVSLHFSPSA